MDQRDIAGLGRLAAQHGPHHPGADFVDVGVERVAGIAPGAFDGRGMEVQAVGHLLHNAQLDQAVKRGTRYPPADPTHPALRRFVILGGRDPVQHRIDHRVAHW